MNEILMYMLIIFALQGIYYFTLGFYGIEKIEINRTGKPNQKLWNDGRRVYLWKKILGFYILIWK